MAKKNGTLVRVIVVVALAAISAAFGYGMFKGEIPTRVEHNTERIEKVEVATDKNTEFRISAESHYESIKEDLTEIKGRLPE